MADRPEEATADLQFHYIKSPDFREVPCDGIVGGLTPNGKKVFLSFFAERGPIPRMIQYSVTGTPDQEIKFEDNGSQTPTFVETRHGVVRYIQFGCYMDIATATQVRAWLDKNIQLMEKAAHE